MREAGSLPAQKSAARFAALQRKRAGEFQNAKGRWICAPPGGTDHRPFAISRHVRKIRDIFFMKSIDLLHESKSHGGKL